jgi:arabinogalactan oligomer/maltooligosaccharide transport system substrate-binding protein
MRKSLFALASLLLIASVALTACGAAAPEEPAADPVELTIWHSYHTGENEEKAINQVIALYAETNPDVKVNVLAVPFDQIANKWSTEVAAGGGPDMFTMPNDDLGNWIRGGLVAPVDTYVSGKLDGFSQLAIDGVTYEDQMYAIPGIAKAVGLYYNKSLVDSPATTTDELLQQVNDGTVLVMRPYAYHLFGVLTGAFGGTLMDDTGKCVADQGGFADAYAYLKELKDAGALFEADEGKANTMFQQGEAAYILSGPWMLGTFSESLGDDLGVVPLPAGPGGGATPLTGIDGWYINPNSPNQAAAVDLALFIFGKDGATIYADVAKDPMGRTDIEVSDPMIKTFADLANAGFPRPQSKEFGNWWGAFDDASTKVLEGAAEPADAVTAACTSMNTANEK